MSCVRNDCFAFDKDSRRNCSILSSGYKKNEKCPFYKNKTDVNIKEIEKACAKYRKG